MKSLAAVFLIMVLGSMAAACFDSYIHTDFHGERFEVEEPQSCRYEKDEEIRENIRLYGRITR